MPQATGNAGHSYSIDQSLTCKACGRPFDFRLWLIVDADQRADLFEKLCGGTLHDVDCPHCGDSWQLDAPLLVYRPDADPPILFSPAGQTSEERDREQARHLVGTLRQLVGVAWRDEWLAEGLPGVSRKLLPAALSGDPQAALSQMQERMRAELERLREQDPEQFRELQEQAAQ